MSRSYLPSGSLGLKGVAAGPEASANPQPARSTCSRGEEGEESTSSRGRGGMQGGKVLEGDST